MSAQTEAGQVKRRDHYHVAKGGGLAGPYEFDLSTLRTKRGARMDLAYRIRSLRGRGFKFIKLDDGFYHLVLPTPEWADFSYLIIRHCKGHYCHEVGWTDKTMKTEE